MHRSRERDERGTVLVIVTISMVAILLIVAIGIDIAFLRGGATLDQSTADLTALAGGAELGRGEPESACQDMVSALNSNTPSSVSFDANTFCSPMKFTVCSGGPNAQAAPTATSGKFTVSIRYPVPDAEIADATFGVGLNDATPCERMRVVVTTVEPSFFGRVAGQQSYTTTRSATVRPAKQTEGTLPPALWVLEPTKCPAIETSGAGTTVTVGNLLSVPVTRGIVQVESDGTGPGCSASRPTITSQGLVEAQPSSGLPVSRGEIRLFALPRGATTCSVATACSQSEVGANIRPQPTSAVERATRAPVDWKWNCKDGYPSYLGLTIKNCPQPAAPRIDQLVAAIGPSGQPPGFQRWTASHPCSPSGNVVVSGNWWVDCPAGLSISTGTAVTFANGNVVFDGSIRMTGSGQLSVNTANTNLTPVPATCTIPCTATASAAFVYLRSGDIDVKSQITFRRTAVYLSPASALKLTGGAQPNWTAPVDGPFAGLALWGEAAGSSFSMSGGAGVSLEGTFFTPYADPMTITGGGNWGQQSAQFIAQRLRLTGGSVISMTPSSNSVSLPPTSGVLIR